MQSLALSSVRSHDSSVIAVRKRQLHKGPVASVAEPGLIPRTKRCAMHDTRVADGPIDPPTEHIQETGDVARPSLTAKLESAIRRVSAIRCFFQTASNHTADAAPPLTLAQSLSFSQELGEVEKELWDMRVAARSCSGSIDARFQMARRRSAKEVKLAGPRKKRVASEARKEAGKRKVGSLSNWHGEVRTAHQDLKGNGYSGTLKLKKGMPLYERIQENRRARLCANVPGTLEATSKTMKPAKQLRLAVGSGASTAGGVERYIMRSDSVADAPADLRTMAKRGDDNISVTSAGI